MPQYLVSAYDGTDAEAPARRQAIRPTHIPSVQALAESGNLIVGGALLDAGGQVIGSVAVADFPDRAGLDAWLAREPYVTGNVWQRIEIVPMTIAVRAKTP